MNNPSQTLLPGSFPGGGSPGSPNGFATSYQTTKNRIAALQGGPKSGLLGIALLIALPWCTFTLITVSFAILFHAHEHLVWFLVLAILLIGALFFVLDSRNKFGGKWYSKLGSLTLFAALASTYLGLYNYHQNMALYWTYKENVHYSNVLPSENAAAHGDAGKMLFTIDTKVDVAKSVGYKAHSTYCVAPIIDYATTVVEYWAVGIDCCESRGGFACGDVWNPKARSAVVIGDDLDRSFNNQMMFFYRKAAAQAVAEWNLVQGSQPMFVRWVVDATAAQDEYFTQGSAYAVIAIAVYLFISVVAGIMVQMSSKTGTQAPTAGGAPPNTTGGPRIRLPAV